MNDPAFNLLFVEDVDRETDEGMVEEMYYSMVQRHPYYVLDQEVALNLYGEPEGEPSYRQITPDIPIQVKIDPEAEELNKYGYDRTRDALLSFSAKILRDSDLMPKVGDRLDYVFKDANGSEVIEHLELHEVSAADFSRQTLVSYQMTAAADRTHKAMKP